MGTNGDRLRDPDDYPQGYSDDGREGERRRVAPASKTQMVDDILALKDLPDQIDAPVIDYPESPHPRARELTPKQQRDVDEAARRSVYKNMAIEGRVPECGFADKPIKRLAGSAVVAEIAALREAEAGVQSRDEDDA